MGEESGRAPDETEPLEGLNPSRGDYTPAPWAWQEREFGEGRIVARGEVLASVRTEGAEGFANLLLMHAAPKLLEACIALQMEARARKCGLRIADEAIAEAQGATTCGSGGGSKERDAVCILRRQPSFWRSVRLNIGTETVICGQSIVEQYLREGYSIDWTATDNARAQSPKGRP